MKTKQVGHVANSLDFAVERIVNQCHVACSKRAVLRTVISRMKEGAWEQLDYATKARVIRTVIKTHQLNRELYALVMRGGF